MYWTLDREATLRTEGLNIGVMIYAKVPRIFGFGLEITEAQLLVIKNGWVGKSYKYTKAATYLHRNPIKSPLKYPHLYCIWITTVEWVAIGNIVKLSYRLKATMVDLQFR